jgi:hypothetical protein
LNTIFGFNPAIPLVSCVPKAGKALVSKSAIVGWGISTAGMALWLYGYFITDTPPLIDWHAYTPWWIADFLPNIQSEIGMALICIGTALVYWPSQR